MTMKIRLFHLLVDQNDETNIHAHDTQQALDLFLLMTF